VNISAIFVKILNGLNRILTGHGETDSLKKKPEVEKISCETPFKMIEVNDAVPVVVGLLRLMTEAGLQLDLSSSTSLAFTTLRD
jgi:hypothetical protein